jgi:actin-related protein
LRHIPEQALVFDSGSGYFKAGYAGEAQPLIMTPTIVGREKLRSYYKKSDRDNVYIGDEAEEKRAILTLSSPIQDGVVSNWDDMESLWAKAFTELNANPEEYSLMTTAPFHTIENRERMVQILFEAFNIPAVYITDQALLSLYSCGLTSGVVLTAGEAATYALPIFEGSSIHSAVQRGAVSGSDLTSSLKKMLAVKGFNFDTSSEMRLLLDIKKRGKYIITSSMCKRCQLANVLTFCWFLEHIRWFLAGYVNIDSDTGRGSEAGASSFDAGARAGSSFVLPDGRSIDLGSEMHRLPELMFRPGAEGGTTADGVMTGAGNAEAR